MKSISSDAAAVIDAFESSWLESPGDPPDMGDFIAEATPGDERRSLLLELVRVDMELRWEHDRAPLFVEDYVAKFPELSPVESLPADLIIDELQARRRAGVSFAPDEYSQRFPHLSQKFDELSISLTAGLSTSPTATDALPSREGFEILDAVATGGMGQILRARDPQFDRELAIKVLRPELAEDKSARKRFLTEAAIQGELQHPGVPPVHEMGRLPDGRLFFAMKLIAGRTLAELMKGRATPRDGLPALLDHFESMCQTVAFAHSIGIIHRDLKPQNVMVGAFGEVQVMDWGMAKRLSSETPTNVRTGSMTETVPAGELEDTIVAAGSGTDTAQTQLTQAGELMGTPAYMPPEQAVGDIEHLNARADVFSLGAILCEILTGLPPYTGSSVHEVIARAQTVDLKEAKERLNHESVDADLAGIANHCLAWGLSERPNDAGAVVTALEDYRRSVAGRLEEEKLSRTRAEAKAEEERRRRVVGRWLAAAILMIVALVAVAGVWYVNDRADERERDLAQKTERESRGRRTAFEIRTALAAGNRELRSLERKLGDPVRFRLLASQPGEWDDILERASNARKQIITARNTNAELVDDDLQQSIREFESRLSKHNADRGLSKQLEKILLDAEMVVGSHTSPAAETARNLRHFFRDLGWQVGDEVGIAGAEQYVSQSTIRWSLVDALDAWRFAEGIKLAPWLNELLARVDPDPWRNRVRRWTENRSDAREELEKLAAHESVRTQSPIQLVALSGWFRSMQQYAQAEQILRRATENNRADFWLWMRAGSRSRDRDWKLIAYNAAVSIRPNNATALSNLAMTHTRARRFEDAKRLVEYAIKLAPRHPKILNNLGVVAYYRKDFDEAEKHYRQVIALDPQNAAAYSNLGVIARERLKFKESLGHFRKAIQLVPGFVDAHHNLMVTYFQLNRLPEAEAQCCEILELEPNHARANFHLARVHERRRELAKAETLARRSVKSNPDSVDARSLLGAILAQQNKFAPAVEEYAHAVRLSPENVMLRLMFAQALRRTRQFKKSLDQYLLVERRLPTGHQLMAACKQGIEQCRDAIRKSGPGDSDQKTAKELVRRAREMLKERRGYVLATKYFQDALKKDPDLKVNLAAGIEFDAARAAAMASEARSLNASQKDLFRRISLNFLHSELDSWNILARQTRLAVPAAARRILRSRIHHPDLEHLRNSGLLFSRTGNTQARVAWTYLWVDLRHVLQQLDAFAADGRMTLNAQRP